MTVKTISEAISYCRDEKFMDQNMLAIAEMLEAMQVENNAMKKTKYRSDRAELLENTGTDNWKTDILARDMLDNLCLISSLANLLYDDLSAKARENRLFEEGGNIILQLDKAAKNEQKKIARHYLYRCTALPPESP